MENIKMFYKEKEVKLGEIILINGIKVVLDMELLKNNPQLFKVVEEEDIPEYVEIKDPDIWENTIKQNNGGIIFPIDFYSEYGKMTMREAWKNQPHNLKRSSKKAYDKQELLVEAKRRYPKGTVHTGQADLNRYIVDEPYYDDFGNIMGNINGGCIRSAATKNWAKIVKPIFTTEDGVDIYNGDTYYYVSKKILKYIYNNTAGPNQIFSPDYIRFSTKELAEEYIAKNKVKTLDDYEDILLKYKRKGIHHPLYIDLKEQEPKLYYQKVLQLIADDLNKGWNPTIGISHYFIKLDRDDYTTVAHNSVIYSMIYFKSRRAAEKAIDIMGDKLNYIWK